MQREDPLVDVVTLETPNLSSLIGSNSATLPGKFPLIEMQLSGELSKYYICKKISIQIFFMFLQ